MTLGLSWNSLLMAVISRCVKFCHYRYWFLYNLGFCIQESPADADDSRDSKGCKNCSNSMCFVSFHRISFPQISNYQCIASRAMFRL